MGVTALFTNQVYFNAFERAEYITAQPAAGVAI